MKFLSTFLPLSVSLALCAQPTPLPQLKSNVELADQFAGATLDVKLNACIGALVERGGGICDARALGGSQTLAAEVDVGDSIGNTPVTLLLPSTGYWYATMAGGTAYALKVNNKSSAIGYGSGEGQPFAIVAHSGSSLDSVCGTNPSTVSSYVRMEGFACWAAAGSKVANAVLNVQYLFDESYIGKITAAAFLGSTVSKVFWAHNMCCSTTIELINAEAYSNAGTVPCTISTIPGRNPMVAAHFRDFSCVHPGSGLSAFVLNQQNNGYGNRIENIYIEISAAKDLTTPAVQVTGAAIGTDFIEGVALGTDVARSTRYVFDIARGANVDISNLTLGPISTNAIHDHNGPTVLTGAVRSSIRQYGHSSGYFNDISAHGIDTDRLRTNLFNQGATNHFAGVSACVSGTMTIPLPITYHSQPSILVFDETTAGGIKLSAKSRSSFTVSCTGATDAFDWVVVGNPN